MTRRAYLSRPDWDELCAERFAIMHLAGNIPEPLVKEKAYSETTKRFGPRPQEGSKP